jgi:amino acid transporter
MSETARVPFSETKGPEAPERLHRGALRLVDISASTMANIGPAYSFYFGFGLLVITAGIAAPLTILAAIVAVALLGNTLSQFSRAQPSTGGFITFVGKTFGGTSAVTTALLCGAGYIIAISSVLVISGGFLSMTLQYYAGADIPWIIFSLVLTAGAMVMMIRGVAVSTKLAGFFFGFELAVLLIVAIATLIKNGGHLSAAPFDPGNITNGFSGLSAGFPLAVYMFIGWENSAALAEETNEPRRAVPRAIFLSIVAMTISYLLFAYTTVVGFGYDTKALSDTEVPFVSVAQSVLGGAAVLAYIAGFTSIIGALISASNSQSRLIFNAGREGLLPKVVARVTRESRTPWVSFVVYLAIALGLAFGWGWTLDPVEFFGYSATLGTILVAATWLVANLALPVYYRRTHPDRFNLVRHGVLPLLGVLAIGFPLYELVKPGRPSPFDIFPWISLAIIAVAIVYALILNARDKTLADRVGSIIADAD